MGVHINGCVYQIPKRKIKKQKWIIYLATRGLPIALRGFLPDHSNKFAYDCKNIIFLFSSKQRFPLGNQCHFTPLVRKPITPQALNIAPLPMILPDEPIRTLKCESHSQKGERNSLLPAFLSAFTDHRAQRIRHWHDPNSCTLWLQFRSRLRSHNRPFK